VQTTYEIHCREIGSHAASLSSGHAAADLDTQKKPGPMLKKAPVCACMYDKHDKLVCVCMGWNNHVCMCVCVCVCLCAYVYAYVYVRACVHVCIHT
jgi:hypothetical protein